MSWNVHPMQPLYDGVLEALRKGKWALDCDVYAAPSPIHGTGLFGNVAHEPLDKITFMEGDLISYREAVTTSDKDYIRTLFPQNLCINGLRKPQSGRGGASFANHSQLPNATFHVTELFGHVPICWLLCKKSIKAHEEITVDYGDMYWARNVCCCTTCCTVKHMFCLGDVWDVLGFCKRSYSYSSS